MENNGRIDSEAGYETNASEDEDSSEEDVSELTGIWGEDEPDFEGGIGDLVSLRKLSRSQNLSRSM